MCADVCLLFAGRQETLQAADDEMFSLQQPPQKHKLASFNIAIFRFC
jgi:hypothetical protein